MKQGVTYLVHTVHPELLEGGVAGNLLGGQRRESGDQRRFHGERKMAFFSVPDGK